MTRDGLALRLSDAFALTADPSAYVPRLALESALAELTEGIGKTPSCAALTGESGMGKTLLLHVLRERLRGSYECLYVPFPRLAAGELWRWIAVALGLGSGSDDRGAVLGRALRLASEGMGLVLLVDDAGALPPATRDELIGACETNGLSLVMAFDSADYDLLAALPAEVRRIDLGPPMTPAEMRAYIHARLRRVDPEGAVAASLGAQRLAALHEASGGVPARLHALLDAWLHEAEEALLPDQLARSALEAVDPLEAPQDSEPFALEAALPHGVQRVLARLESPRVQIAILVLFVIAVFGLWNFALEHSSGVRASVPVESSAPAVEAPESR